MNLIIIILMSSTRGRNVGGGVISNTGEEGGVKIKPNTTQKIVRMGKVIQKKIL